MSERVPGRAQVEEQGEEENADARGMVNRINERLEGFYNIRTQRQKRLPAASVSRDTPPLSIRGQVHRLIKEAVSDKNLSAMYIGWMPFL